MAVSVLNLPASHACYEYGQNGENEGHASGVLQSGHTIKLADSS
jgi:hypothetical protein